MDRFVDTVPDFYLWQPSCRREEAGVVCCFDVTAPELAGLAKGDAAIMASFAKALRLDGAVVRSWIVQRFCSPYYAHEPGSADWRDRIALCWRVELWLDNYDVVFEDKDLNPVAANGRDSTYEYGTFWDGGAEECVVIADNFSGDGFDFLSKSVAPSAIEIADKPRSGRTWQQARIDFGVLRLPDEEPKIATILSLCAQHKVSTHWAETLRSASV